MRSDPATNHARILAGHRPVYERAATRFVKGLQEASAADGRRFAGYAPVLETVATALAGITNPATVNDSVEQSMRGQILQDLPARILKRESTKLRSQLAGQIPDDKIAALYTAEEQLDRLAAIVLDTPSPAAPADLEPEHLSAYDEAVKGLVSQHPFLDGTGREPSGAVFAAVIYAHALFSTVQDCVSAAERRAGNGPHTPNPFLVDFYLGKSKPDSVIPPEHLILLYDSIRSRAEVGDIVRLTVDAEEGDETAEVEIQVGSASAGPKDRPRLINLKTSQAGSLRFGRQVNGVSVDAPDLDVVIGSGNPVEMVAPVYLNVGRLSFNCPEIVVVSNDKGSLNEDASVLLETQELRETTLMSVPQIRKGVELQVSWPGASAYPWSRFATNADRPERHDLDPALRGLRRLVMAFRSHSRGRLARYKGKIEHARITKGALGDAIRQQMLNDGILSLEDNIYFLDPDALGRTVGASYQDLKLKRFNDKVRQYVAAIHV